MAASVGVAIAVRGRRLLSMWLLRGVVGVRGDVGDGSVVVGLGVHGLVLFASLKLLACSFSFFRALALTFLIIKMPRELCHSFK